MLRSDWLIVLIFAMCLSLATCGLADSWAHKTTYEKYQRYLDAAGVHREVDRTLAPTLAFNALESRRPCDRPMAKTESELCIQWEAAAAAKQSADWAFWSLIVGIGGVLGLVVTLWFNFRTLGLTQSSAKDAGKAIELASRNAEAAAALAANSREMGTAQVRAYLSITDASIQLSDVGAATIIFTITNNGNSPASRIEVNGSGSYGFLQNIDVDAPYNPYYGKETFGWSALQYPDDIPSAKSDVIVMKVDQEIFLPPDTLSWFTKAASAYEVKIETRYDDVFRNRQSDGIVLSILRKPGEDLSQPTPMTPVPHIFQPD